MFTLVFPNDLVVCFTYFEISRKITKVLKPFTSLKCSPLIFPSQDQFAWSNVFVTFSCESTPQKNDNNNNKIIKNENVNKIKGVRSFATNQVQLLLK